MKNTDKQWLSSAGEASLLGVHRSIPVSSSRSTLKRALSFVGPGYLVAVGYMDPGNWATSLAGGASFGYALMSVVVLSSLMAILLQALCARLAIATGRDLAQACRDAFPKPVSLTLWALAEISIMATDIAEVIGTAIGIKLLFGIPLSIGVLITALDAFLILYLQRLGFRWLEAFVIGLLAVIAGCFAMQIVIARPDVMAVLGGLIPTGELLSNPQMLYLALGILGATVMPHNLYLHSGIVQTRAYGNSPPERREAIRFACIDSSVALVFALLINASILVLSAAAFHGSGHADLVDLESAYSLLNPVLGSSVAAVLFGISLICCGLNSTITATLAGQIIMEGFLRIRLSPWLRRLLTRAVAIVPAIGVTLLYGDAGASSLLVLTQVVLSLQLSFAVFPLVMFVSDKARMGELVAPRWLALTSWTVAIFIALLNLKLVADFLFT